MRSKWLGLFTGFIASIAFATADAKEQIIYKTTDKFGHTVFTDKKPVNKPFNEINDNHLQTYKAPTSLPALNTGNKIASPMPTALIIESPSEGSVFWNEAEIPVSINFLPQLSSGAEVQLFVDDELIGRFDQKEMMIHLPRGTYHLDVRLVQNGVVLQKSATIQITVQKHHV